METAIDYMASRRRKEIEVDKSIAQPVWQRIVLLTVLGYEATGCLMGGAAF